MLTSLRRWRKNSTLGGTDAGPSTELEPQITTGVALFGQAGVGKNHLANSMAEQLAMNGLNVGMTAFADALKAEVLERSGLTKESPGGREELQYWGMKRREEDPDYWVKRLEQTAIAAWTQNCVPIITDGRFQNEYEWCVKMGFYTAFVLADPTARSYRLLERDGSHTVNQEHPSEKFEWIEGTPWDAIVWNGNRAVVDVGMYATPSDFVSDALARFVRR